MLSSSGRGGVHGVRRIHGACASTINVEEAQAGLRLHTSSHNSGFVWHENHHEQQHHQDNRGTP